MKSRRDFLSLAGKSLGLAALSVPTIGALRERSRSRDAKCCASDAGASRDG